MVHHQKIFKEISDLLSKHVAVKLDEVDHGTQLTIDETEIWLDCDPHELTIGYGLVHHHYNPNHNDLKKAIEQLINVLTRRKRITTYHKGNRIFKRKTEIEVQNGKFEHFGTAMTWAFPFWRRTTKTIQFHEPLIDFIKIENEIQAIYRLM